MAGPKERMSDKRYYVTLVFAFFIVALVLGTILELINNG